MLKNSAVQLISAYCVEQMNSIASGSLVWDEFEFPPKKPHKRVINQTESSNVGLYTCAVIFVTSYRKSVYSKSHMGEKQAVT